MAAAPDSAPITLYLTLHRAWPLKRIQAPLHTHTLSPHRICPPLHTYVHRFATVLHVRRLAMDLFKCRPWC